jgi:hypothetical protein
MREKGRLSLAESRKEPMTAIAPLALLALSLPERLAPSPGFRPRSRDYAIQRTSQSLRLRPPGRCRRIGQKIGLVR